MAAVLKFKQAKVERQPGEMARLKVVRGPDYGTIFIMTGSRAVLGRGEGNEIVISDLKASRVHAAIALGPGGSWSIKDQGSANGILHNGQQTREGVLRSGDTITLGETTLEFMAAEAGTAMLSAPAKSFTQVRADHAAFAARKQAVVGIAGRTAGRKNPLLIIGAIGLLAMFALPGESEKEKKPAKDRKPGATSPLARDPAALMSEGPGNKAAEMFYDIGFREYRQGNYLRARRQFETVLQVVPDHYLAGRYLDECDKRIEEEVKFHLAQGKKTLDSGKLKQARGHFETVLRLLHRNQSDPIYIEAKSQLELAIKQLPGAPPPPAGSQTAQGGGG